MPGVKLSAESVRLTETGAAAPAASVPPVDETFNQDEVFINDQVSEEDPLLVTEIVSEAGLKGPPTGPTAANPVAGNNPSQLVTPDRALIKFCPAGVPQPVQRS